MASITALNIDRTEWYRGQGGYGSNLSKRCCVGFFAKEIGFSNSDILNINYLVYADEDSPPQVGGLGQSRLVTNDKDYKWLADIVTNTDLSVSIFLGRINDDPKLTDANREILIKGVFLDHGITVTFFN